MPPETNATPGAEPVDATATPVVVEQEEEGTEGHEAGGEPAEAVEGEKKPQWTDEQKEIYNLKRRVGRLTRDKALAEAEVQLARKQQATAEAPRTEEPASLTEEEVNRRADVIAARRDEQRTLTRMINTAVEQGQKAYKDFDAKTAIVEFELDGFVDAKGDMRPVTAAILHADKSHELINYLAENPELASELATLPPIHQIRRVAQLEIEMGKTSKPKPSGAPKPINPVKGSGGGSDEPDPKDHKAWIAWRNKTTAR